MLQLLCITTLSTVPESCQHRRDTTDTGVTTGLPAFKEQGKNKPSKQTQEQLSGQKGWNSYTYKSLFCQASPAVGSLLSLLPPAPYRDVVHGGRRIKAPVTDECDRDSVFQCRNGCPLPCALLPCTVSDLGEEVFAISVFVFENIGCDFNQERVQLCLIPLLKYLKKEKKYIHIHTHPNLLCLYYIF